MTSSHGRVLVVDDEPIVREVLERYLHRGGFDVTTAGDGQAALDSFAADRPDLIVLDLMLPGIDGLEVFRRIRDQHRGTGVIMLTARGEETDRVVGLDLGADDYVAKPFSPREVVARARAVLRRSGIGAAPPAPARDVLCLGELEIDLNAREVTVDGNPVELTPKEFDLLSFFAANPRTVFSRTQLLEEVWDIAYAGDPSTVTVHIRRLREKIEPNPAAPRHLLTVWGVGYRLEP
jgi:two-component system, OmpR family, response regulator ResD